jgi:hypothetical protein
MSKDNAFELSWMNVPRSAVGKMIVPAAVADSDQAWGLEFLLNHAKQAFVTT